MASRAIRKLFESLAIIESGCVLIMNHVDGNLNLLANRILKQIEYINSLYPKYIHNFGDKEINYIKDKLKLLADRLLDDRDYSYISSLTLTTLSLLLIEDRVNEMPDNIRKNAMLKLIDMINDLHNAFDETDFNALDDAKELYEYWKTL